MIFFLGEQFCWHPVVLDLAPPLRLALRPDAPVVCPGFGFDKLCFWGNVQATCPRCFGEYEEGLFPRQTVLLANCPARPRPATPPCAPTRPARGMSGFWARQVKNELDCSCFQRDVQESFLDLPEENREGYLRAGSTQWRPVLLAPPRPAAPLCAARTRPARGVSGFWILQLHRFTLTMTNGQQFIDQ